MSSSSSSISANASRDLATGRDSGAASPLRRARQPQLHTDLADATVRANPAAYGPISYEVDDGDSVLRYPCSLPPATVTSKYLEDAPSSSRIVDVPEALLHAPASVPSNFSYACNFHEQSSASNQSPLDDARFSTPECAPESQPVSAPMSSEIQYARSPSEKSGRSNCNSSPTAAMEEISGQATLEGLGMNRYESPKNEENAWILEAFYSSPEELNSAEGSEVRKPDDAVTMDSEDSEGRISIVDRLFALLQRAEQESGDGDNEGEASKVNKGDSKSSQIQQLPSLATEMVEGSQSATLCNMMVQIPHLDTHVMAQHYGGEMQQIHAPAGPSYQATTRILTSPSACLLQHAPHEVQLRQSQDFAMQAASSDPLGFYGQAHSVYATSLDVPHPNQYFRADQYQTVPMYPLAECVPSPMPFLQPQTIWDAPVCEQQAPPEVLQQAPWYSHEIGSDGSVSLHSADRSTETSPLTVRSEYETDSDFESISVRSSVRRKKTENKGRVLKGPPFEQKGPTRTKEVAPVPPPPPPSPEFELEKNSNDIVEQLAYETQRLEEMSIHEVADYDRLCEVEELRIKMCERFQRLYPALFDNDGIPDGSGSERSIASDEVDDGDPKDGRVIRNGAQLATRYLALWFPDAKERARMIPWNVVKKIKPIRLCFLDNRIGHGEYEEFNIGEFLSVTGHMMFTYGDGPEALDSSRLFVLDIVRELSLTQTYSLYTKVIQYGYDGW
ncbi:unnamed protein product [Heligmosomoides polygyrus]|uniref:Myb-like domain-containing protein n=1 Tax=Heligmosomoides polygyrus TaxID=6339 RepID=A0A183G3A3_HELPZ|nr:unnamed protein product [Heligmosomoides polygyrus]